METPMPHKSRVFVLTISLLLVSLDSLAGKDIPDSQVPPAVLAAFKASYPSATDVEFEEELKNGIKVYEIEFKVDGIKREVDYSPDGKVLKDEKDD
jgi:hypothetical protein